MATYTSDASGRVIVEPEPAPLSEEHLQTAAKIIRSRAGEAVKDDDTERLKELDARRQARLTREEYESLTAEERADYDRQYSPLAIVSRLAEQARREADEHWMQAERQRQHELLEEWAKMQSAGVSSRDQHKKIEELHMAGSKRAQARLEARARRELEAEIHSDDLQRIWAGLDDDERKVFKRLMDEEPSELERIRRFKADRRNPIAGINDARQLYRLANQKPKREEWIEPTANIENVDDPRMLYKMALRDAIQNKKEGAR